MPKRERLFEYHGYYIASRSDGRSRNFYRYRYEPGGVSGRQAPGISLGTADLEEAKDKLIAWVQEHAELPKGDRKSVTLAQCLQRYLNRLAKKKPALERSRIAARQILEYWGPAVVADLTPQRQHDFHEHLRTHREVGGRRRPGELAKLDSRPRSPETVSNVLSVLRAAVKDAVKWQELTEAPFIFDVERPEKKKAPLELAAIAALLQAADRDYLRAFIWLTLGTAGRKEAILELTWFQVDTKRRLIFLNPEGREQTSKRRGTVPICDTLQRVLEALPRSGERLVNDHGRSLKDIKSAWHRARKQAGLPGRVTPNLLRHTLGAEFRARGVPEGEATGFMAHRWTEATTEEYATWRPDYLGSAAKAVDAVLNEIARCLRHRAIDRDNRGAFHLRSTAASGGPDRPAELKDFMVGATGIEPVTPTMST